MAVAVWWLELTNRQREKFVREHKLYRPITVYSLVQKLNDLL